MKKLFLRSLLVLAGFASLIIPAKAQADVQMVVKIPFQFVAAGITFPAGEYRLSRLDDTSDEILVLSPLDNRAARTIMLVAQGKSTPHGKAQLTFATVGDQHFLSRIESSNDAYILWVPRAEALLAATPKGSAASSSN